MDIKYANLLQNSRKLVLNGRETSLRQDPRNPPSKAMHFFDLIKILVQPCLHTRGGLVTQADMKMDMKNTIKQATQNYPAQQLG